MGMDIEGATAHVFLLEAARPFAGGRLDLSLPFYGDHERALHVPAGRPTPVFTRWRQIKNRPSSGNPEFMIQEKKKTKGTHLLLSPHAGQSEM
jgi:hypothetical protein